jgi:N-acetyl-anhydromuramoyl-L-alanine amidase
MTQSPLDISDTPSRIVDGWLAPARRVESPNFNQRAAGETVDLLVIHNISLPPGQFGTGCVEQFFCNQLDHSAHPFFAEIQSLQVSSHLLIERSGEVIQFVSFDDRAWHAGLSCFQGRESCNDFSIGIELEGTDDTPYTDEQYRQLTVVTRAIQNSYPAITTDRIAGHSDIAPERKTDPGPAFDWDRFRRELAAGGS